MQLTRHTDLAFRLLIHLARVGEGRCLIADVAREQEISRTHLMKVASKLAHAGIVDAARGNGGGLKLAKPAGEINVGAVIDAMEPSCALIDCTACRLLSGCGLPNALQRGKRAFLEEMSRYTLADVAA